MAFFSIKYSIFTRILQQAQAYIHVCLEKGKGKFFNEGRFKFLLTCHVEFFHDNVDTFLLLLAIFVMM